GPSVWKLKPRPGVSSCGLLTPRSRRRPSTGSRPAGPSRASSSPARPSRARKRSDPASLVRAAAMADGSRSTPMTSAPAASRTSACPPPPSVASTRRFPGTGFKSATTSSRRTVSWTNDKGTDGSVQPGVVALAQCLPGVAGVRVDLERVVRARGAQDREQVARHPGELHVTAAEPVLLRLRDQPGHAPIVDVAHVGEVQHQPHAALIQQPSHAVADGADRIAVQLAHAGQGGVLEPQRGLGLHLTRLLRHLGHDCSLPWRSSVSTRITSAESAAPRASSCALRHPSWLHSSMTFTIPAQTTSFSSPAWLRSTGGIRIRPSLSSGHS